MIGRILALVAVAVSLVGFIGQEAGWTGWWTLALSRGSYVLIVLAVVAALLAARRPNVFVAGAQVLAALAALAFEIVALVKYYEPSSFAGIPVERALTWAAQGQLFGVAALAFALTLEPGGGGCCEKGAHRGQRPPHIRREVIPQRDCVDRRANRQSYRRR